MDLQFPKTELECLNRVLWESKNEEQTQEIKLTDSMPDVGKVLGVWGQPLVRGKEWRGNGMGVSGGVMAWVLYQPEDGSDPRMVETWIPWQIRWDFPQTQRDGTMRVGCLLHSIDARATSARKMMVRAVVSVSGEALEPGYTELFTPAEVPGDIQLLRRSYPVRIPKEAGEKTITFDEELNLPSGWGQPQKLLQYTLQPELTDKKVMGDKVVFRGAVLLHGIVRCDDGRLKPLDLEVAFSQFAELDREYDSSATASILLTPTGLEAELQEDGKIRMKAGLTGQYVIYDQPVIEVVEDAYSTGRAVSASVQELSLPAVLDMQQQTVNIHQPLTQPEGEVLDTSFVSGNPLQQTQDNGIGITLSGVFQILSYDENGAVQSKAERWEETCEIAADENARVMPYTAPTGRPYCTDGFAYGSIGMEVLTTAPTRIPMITGLELGEASQPDPGRPSLILCRAGGESLWSLAKRCGSTVDAIREANGISEAPAENQMILIPVS